MEEVPNVQMQTPFTATKRNMSEVFAGTRPNVHPAVRSYIYILNTIGWFGQTLQALSKQSLLSTSDT